MRYEIKCSACGKSTPSLLDFKCSSCGQPLYVLQNRKFATEHIRKKVHSLWRYAAFFPYVEKTGVITLGEGWTPLVEFSENVCFKLENLNPTGSFKDRGSATLISAIHRLIEKNRGYVSEDSSGNAGASIAAYAARAGLRAKIYVPENVSEQKLAQTLSYGATVVRVSGSRAKVAEEAQRVEKAKFYVGHILHPLFKDGIRSLAYEIAEQLKWKMSAHVYLPASAGTLLLGVISGFDHLVESGLLETMPRIVACQTRQVSPLYHRLKNLPYTPPPRITSIADALVSVQPPLLGLMVEQLRKADGDAVVVEEEEIIQAFKELSHHGFLVEPSSAVAYAAYIKQLKSDEVSKSDETVIILTGTGLKTSFSNT